MAEPTIKEFMKDMMYMDTINDSRYRILILQLYAEHYVNKILMHFANEKIMGKEIREELSFIKKLGILKKAGIINSEMNNILFALSNIRNTATHNIIIDEKIINAKLKERKLWLDDFKIGFNRDGEEFTGFNLKEMYEECKATEYAQLNVSSMLVIGILNMRLKIIKKEVVDFILFPELEKKDNGDFVVNVTISERSKEQNPK